MEPTFVDFDVARWECPGGVNAIPNLYLVFGKRWWPGWLWTLNVTRGIPQKEVTTRQTAYVRGGIRLRRGGWRFVQEGEVPQAMWLAAMQKCRPFQPRGTTARAVLMWMMVDGRQ
jgi:hypothetical protein